MPVTDNILASVRYMAGNPVMVSMFAGVNSTCKYRIYTYTLSTTKLIYEGSITTIDNYVVIDISDFFTDLANIAGVSECKICLIHGSEPEPLAGSNIKYFTVYGGGISKLLRRKLAALGSDIFTAKIKNNDKNFFLTTRTNDRIIYIPEDELMLLKYYAKGLNFVVKNGIDIIQSYYDLGDAFDVLCDIDIDMLRRKVMKDYNRLASIFDFYTDHNSYICTIVITSVDVSHEYFLKFRNSWGAIEKIGICGLIEYKPEFAEPESIVEWDSTIFDYVEKQGRKTVTNVYNAQIENKTFADRMFLMDALYSNECYFVAGGVDYSVKISFDSNVIQSTGSEPISIQITIKLLDTDTRFSQLIEKDDAIMGTTTSEVITTNNFKNLL